MISFDANERQIRLLMEENERLKEELKLVRLAAEWSPIQSMKRALQSRAAEIERLEAEVYRLKSDRLRLSVVITETKRRLYMERRAAKPA